MVEWWVQCMFGAACTRSGHVIGADEVPRHRAVDGEVRGPRITCPDCGRSSPNANDIANGYCPGCHWWTSDDDLGRARRIERAGAAQLARRYFDEVTAVGLLEDGVRVQDLGPLRLRYVQDVVGDAAVSDSLRRWATAGHSGG